MAAKGKKKEIAVAEASTGARYEELKRMLVERQREIMNEVQGKIRDVRAEASDKAHEVLDPGETSEVDIQEDIEFALIQMKAETLNKINEALWRASKRGPTVTASSAVRKSRSRVCAPCPSPSVARIAKRPARLPSSASASPPAADRLLSASTCGGNTLGVLESQAPPAAGPVKHPPPAHSK